MQDKEKREMGGIDEELSDRIVFITTQEFWNITKGSSAPVEPFDSPFLSQSVEQVRDWFDANITQTDRKGYMYNCFLVLNAQSVQDDTGILVFTLDKPLGQLLRCDFYMAVDTAIDCDIGQSMEEAGGGHPGPLRAQWGYHDERKL